MKPNMNYILFPFNEKCELTGEPFFGAGSFEQEQLLRGKARQMVAAIVPRPLPLNALEWGRELDAGRLHGFLIK